jgi:hypothetical protein
MNRRLAASRRNSLPSSLPSVVGSLKSIGADESKVKQNRRRSSGSTRQPSASMTGEYYTPVRRGNFPIAVSIESPVLCDARLHCSAPSVVPGAGELPLMQKSENTAKQEARDADLSLMPPHPELQRNALKTELPLDAVMQILTTFMRINSISYQLKHEEDRMFLDCTTPNMVRFVVNLWRGQETKVVVQMERRMGCAVETQQFRRCLFRAIQAGRDSTPLISVQARRRICPRHIKKQFKEKECNDNKEKEVTFCVNKCRELMESRCSDRQRLALEYLARLTDPSSVSPETAEIVAKMLLFEDSSSSACSLRSTFAVYIQKCRQRQSSRHLQVLVGGSLATHSSAVMHSLALKALSNALQILVNARSSSKTNPSVDLNSGFWIIVSGALVQNIMDAVDRPQDAALSAKCLCLIKELSPISDVPESNTLIPLLDQGKQYGKAYHSELERASQGLIFQLEGRRVQHTLRNVFRSKNNDE